MYHLDITTAFLELTVGKNDSVLGILSKTGWSRSFLIKFFNSAIYNRFFFRKKKHLVFLGVANVIERLMKSF